MPTVTDYHKSVATVVLCDRQTDTAELSNAIDSVAETEPTRDLARARAKLVALQADVVANSVASSAPMAAAGSVASAAASAPSGSVDGSVASAPSPQNATSPQNAQQVRAARAALARQTP